VSCAGLDSATHPLLERVEVLRNERVAQGVGLLVLHSPRIAAGVEPGQFVHLRVATGVDFLLRRPFSVHRVAGDAIEIRIPEKWTGSFGFSTRVKRSSTGASRLRFRYGLLPVTAGARR